MNDTWLPVVKIMTIGLRNLQHWHHAVIYNIIFKPKPQYTPIMKEHLGGSVE